MPPAASTTREETRSVDGEIEWPGTAREFTLRKQRLADRARRCRGRPHRERRARRSVCAEPLKPTTLGIGQIVGDRIEIALLRRHAAGGGEERAIHASTSYLMRAASADFSRERSIAATAFCALSNERSAASTSIISAIASTPASMRRHRPFDDAAARQRRTPHGLSGVRACRHRERTPHADCRIEEAARDAIRHRIEPPVGSRAFDARHSSVRCEILRRDLERVAPRPSRSKPMQCRP